MAKIVRDPLGNEVSIQQAVLDLNERIIQSEDVMDDINKVIERPAMLFRMNGESVQLYYLRAIGWNRTLLIGVRQKAEQLEAIDYELDPPLRRLAELNRKGERLI